MIGDKKKEHDQLLIDFQSGRATVVDVLRAVQWARPDRDNDCSGFCPICRRMEVSRNDNTSKGHKDNCVIRLALESTEQGGSELE